MRRVLAVAALAAVVAAGITCGKDGTGPVAGELKVVFSSPNSGADSGVVLTIVGPGILTSAAPGPGLRLFQQPLGGTTTRFALVGQLNAGATILTIGVENVNAVSQYAGTIQGVAKPDFELRSLGGYGLTIIR